MFLSIVVLFYNVRFAEDFYWVFSDCTFNVSFIHFPFYLLIFFFFSSFLPWLVLLLASPPPLALLPCAGRWGDR